jgi:hypothetical protein
LSCTYIRTPDHHTDAKTPHNVHDRIEQLERLVTSLINGKDSEEPNAATPGGSRMPSHVPVNEDIPATPDRVKLENDTTFYSDSGHWTSILDGISALKDQLDEIPIAAQPRDTTEPEIAGPDLFFGRQRHATKREILAGLPPRSEADQLVTGYFTSMDLAPSIMHRPTFLREVRCTYLMTSMPC